jgi:hypothetical protein
MKIAYSLMLFFSIISQNSFAGETFQNELQRRALNFFLDNAHPATGLVRDEAYNFQSTPDNLRFQRASIAATGFGLAVISNAASRHLIDRDFAQNYARKVLRFARDHVARRKGWFVHFINWQTGDRIASSEYSTIDTALFLAGALYAGQVFPGGEIHQIAQQLYEDVDFTDMLTNGGALPQKLTLTMSYRDASGYSPTQWKNYAEEMELILLGLGSPTHPLPAAAWTAWTRQTLDTPREGSIIGGDKPIFTHQYSQLFIDFRKFYDRYGDYFTNATEATRFNRELAQSNPQYQTFREGFWGLSAGNSPDGYRAFSPKNFNGTVCMACAGASVMFVPDVEQDLEKWKSGDYGSRIWGIYGFADGFNLDRNWVAEQVYGITVGPLFLSFANRTDSTSVWQLFNQIPEIKNALNKASHA